MVPDSSADIRALILTAHPDDECMFFSPTILSLVKQNVHVKALCLSSGMLSCLYRGVNMRLTYMHSFLLASPGNATGLGDIRSQELTSSYRVLGVNATDVDILNHV